MGFYSDSRKYSGSAFLADSNILVTVAHNVRDDDNQPARFVNVVFGLNGLDTINTKKKIRLKGSDFSVPKSYETAMDSNDIAWVNLKDLHNSRENLKWSLTDLPQPSFATCSIPENHGSLEDHFTICGNIYLGEYQSTECYKVEVCSFQFLSNI